MSVPLPVAQGDHYEDNWDRLGAPTVIKLTMGDGLVAARLSEGRRSGG